MSDVMVRAFGGEPVRRGDPDAYHMVFGVGDDEGPRNRVAAYME